MMLSRPLILEVPWHIISPNFISPSSSLRIFQTPTYNSPHPYKARDKSCTTQPFEYHHSLTLINPDFRTAAKMPGVPLHALDNLKAKLRAALKKKGKNDAKKEDKPAETKAESSTAAAAPAAAATTATEATKPEAAAAPAPATAPEAAAAAPATEAAAPAPKPEEPTKPADPAPDPAPAPAPAPAPGKPFLSSTPMCRRTQQMRFTEKPRVQVRKRRYHAPFSSTY
ncbi:hypothetical protein F4778DRAFT_722208 [Xylariomycetidae sp. FL2044]|nr:hypothetical protein F4778DRAFT_722208 [Xylariomycetidae sp. FL2044]